MLGLAGAVGTPEFVLVMGCLPFVCVENNLGPVVAMILLRVFVDGNALKVRSPSLLGLTWTTK